MGRKFYTTVDGLPPPPKPSLLDQFYRPRGEDYTTPPHTQKALESIASTYFKPTPEEEAAEAYQKAFWAEFDSRTPRSAFHDFIHKEADKVPWLDMPPDPPANELVTGPYTEAALIAMHSPVPAPVPSPVQSPSGETSSMSASVDDEDSKPVPDDPSLFPNGSRDLSFIGLQAFFLGIVLASGILLAVYFISIDSAWWRLPAFFACLGIFHFLEYYTQARYNAPSVRASSFLLFNNGKAYAFAHFASTVEIILSNFFPSYQRFLVFSPYTSGAGLIMVVVCQIIRSLAMKQAATNFNHIVATEKKETHKLVTTGIYSVFRHPSYFGFYWWAMGTQLMVGNKVCVGFFAYALWTFFDTRIRAEEQHLVKFFGKQYEEYRKRTGTKIPYIP